MSSHPAVRKAGSADIFNYAVGESANSLSSNSMGNFGFLYLTLILGLDPVLAGVALSISMFWDAITDPVMGHISDNTRSRWGRRHPYLLIGGLSIALIFLAYWTLPQMLHSARAVFIMLLVLQLLFKTAQTIYVVPFTALGFEMCPEYEQRARLQGVRIFLNQILNFGFGALAWPLFFRDTVDASGKTVNGSHIANNYVTMGITVTIVIAVLACYSTFATRHFGPDNRNQPSGDRSVWVFFIKFFAIFQDRLALLVILFSIVSGFAMGLMAQTQMYTYVFFMEFAPWEKTFVHGGGMLAMSGFALWLPHFVRRFDKKPTGFIGLGLAIAGGLGLWAVFSTGLLGPKDGPFMLLGQPFHLSAVVFGLLQMCWWGGCGLVVPLATSMIADAAAISAKKTGGEVRNAGYASVYSFSQKLSWTVTGIIIGGAIKATGFLPGSVDQTPEAIQGIANLTFLSGPLVMLFAALLLVYCPVSRRQVEE
jgi:GPH family glycoside/pentoside/hexuronide:cation symporter